MTRASRVVWVRLRLILALAAAVLFPMVGAGTTASASAPVGYEFDGLAFYQFGAPGDLAGGPGGCPDTGFVRITNNGASTFTGTLGFTAISGFGANDSASYSVTLAPGAHPSFSFNCESSNQFGFNGAFGTTQNGAEFFMMGTVSNGTNSESVNLSVFDKDIHSGAPRLNPFGVALDNYILQGGDPLGRDTSDNYETTQAPGPFQFFEAAPPSEQAITATGMTFSATEGTSFTGPVASFTDPATAATAAEYSATIDWGDGSSLDTTAVVSGGRRALPR